MRKNVLFSVVLVVLILTSLFGVAAADYSIVLKAGDWVEYKTTFTGRPSRNVIGARMDILDVEEDFIAVDLTTQYANGTSVASEMVLNLQTGSTDGNMVVPRNLNVGDQIYDKYQGNITVTGVQHMSLGGAQRSVMLWHDGNTTYCWDRETGVLVNATTTSRRYSFNMQIVSTNIWRPDILVLEPTVFYEVVTAIAVAVVVVVGVLVVRRAQRAKRARSPKGKGAYYLREFQALESRETLDYRLFLQQDSRRY
jgi:hypothetical protein